MADTTRLEARVAEIESLVDLDGAREQRTAEARAKGEREAAEAERLKQAEILRVELAALQRAYLTDVQEAQEHARGLAAAIWRALEGAAVMVRVSHQLTGKPAPIVLGRDVELRFGCRLAAVMSTIPGHAHRLGACEWLSGHYKSADDWHAAEAALLDRHVTPLTKGNYDGTSSDKN